MVCGGLAGGGVVVGGVGVGGVVVVGAVVVGWGGGVGFVWVCASAIFGTSRSNRVRIDRS